jgi:hypothetical protein
MKHRFVWLGHHTSEPVHAIWRVGAGSNAARTAFDAAKRKAIYSQINDYVRG